MGHQTLRVIYHCVRGWIRGYRYGRDPGIGLTAPSKMTMRCHIWDIDQNLHMNNVSQIRASELARWYMGTEGGFLNHLAKEEILMMVGTLAVRYKKPIKPFQKYIVESQIIGWDDKWMFVSQQFKNEQGRLHTQMVVKTILKDLKGKTLAPENFMKALVGEEVMLREKERIKKTNPDMCFDHILSDLTSLDEHLSSQSKLMTKKWEEKYGSSSK